MIKKLEKSNKKPLELKAWHFGTKNKRLLELSPSLGFIYKKTRKRINEFEDKMNVFDRMTSRYCYNFTSEEVRETEDVSTLFNSNLIELILVGINIRNYFGKWPPAKINPCEIFENESCEK